MTEVVQVNTGNADSAEVRKRSRIIRPYPYDTLEESVVIARAIYEKNAGNPMDRLMLAKAVGRTPASSAFRSLITSSAKYGLTQGNYNDAQISLTDLGEAFAGAKGQKELEEALVRAALNPEIFTKFHAVLEQKKFPEDIYAENMLRRDFKVSPELSKECLSIFKANIIYAGLTTEISGSLYVTKRDAARRAALEKEAIKVEEEAIEEAGEPTTPQETQETRVFISHGKNKRILEQVKTMLEFGNYPYEVAVETETTAIPVPDKILDAMRRCSAGIIIISADEQEKLEDENYGINQNVLIEIGAAFVLYDRKVILLVDKRVNLPSNLQGLYKCEYQGNELSWETGLKVQKAITNFRGQTP